MSKGTARLAASGRTLLFAIALYFVGFVLHETSHLAVLHLIGGDGTLIVRPWRFATVDLTLPSLHVQPIPPLDTVRQAVMNFSGPTIAACLFAVSLRWIGNRDLRFAVEANIAILLFYAVIETAYLLLWTSFRIDADVLVTPELNYGVPLALIVIAAVVRGLRPPARPAAGRGGAARTASA